MDVDAQRVVGVEAFLVSGEYRLLLDHLFARLVLGQDVSHQSAAARMSGNGLRQFLPSDMVTEAFETSFFSVTVAVCRDVIGTYLPDDFRPDEKAIDRSYQRQLQLYVAAIEDHLHCLASRDAPSRREYEQFFTKALRVTKQNHSKVVPPSFDGIQRVAIDRIYVTPHLKTSSASPDARMPFEAFVDSIARVVVLGDPGAGKSTLAQKVAYDLADASLRSLRDLTVDVRVLPITVVLRDYASQRDAGLSVIDYVETSSRSKNQLKPPSGVYEWMLTTGRAFVIFDGLDEVLDTRDRAEMAEVIQTFASLYPATPILVTSRRVGYVEAPLEENMFQSFDLVEFDVDQVRDYASKWFRMSHGGAQKVDQFMTDSELVPDLRSNALMLALMCNIYRIEGYIPRNRPDVYEKCALMLFERWDRGRGIEVVLPFEAHVGPAMRHFAHWIYTDPRRQNGVTESQLIDEATSYLRRRFEDDDEARSAAREFVAFCRGRAWVFTDVGLTPEGESLYQFTHRTFLEYFAALHLTRLAESNRALVRSLLPRIRRAEWDVVAQLAVQVSARQREDGADESLEILLDAARKARSERSKCNLLDFALRCLTFLVPRPDVVRRVVNDAVAAVLDTSAAAQPRGDDPAGGPSRFTIVFRAARENREVALDHLGKVLDSVYASDDSARKSTALAHLVTARDFLPQKIDAGQGPDPVLSAHERLVEQTQRVWVECHPQHLWMAVSGWWRRFVTADEIVASHGPGALFMAGYADVVHTTWYPLCDGALVNIMLGRRRANDRDDEVLAAAYDQICQHRGALELTPGRHEDYYFPYLIECVFGLPSALGSDVTPPTFKQALAPRDRRRNCWVLAACVERNEHQAQASPSDIVGRQLTNRGPKHALEAVVLARHRPRRSSRLDDPLAAIRRTSREMLAKVDPELVQWANGDLTIWADPKG